MVRVDIKPMSVNQAWQGKRYKTDIYKSYEKSVLLMLPKLALPLPPFKIYYEFGMSNSLSDWDNPVKPLQDILQKRYGFNDKDIHEANVKKISVPKGKEYFQFKLETL